MPTGRTNLCNEANRQKHRRLEQFSERFETKSCNDSSQSSQTLSNKDELGKTSDINNLPFSEEEGKLITGLLCIKTIRFNFHNGKHFKNYQNRYLSND